MFWTIAVVLVLIAAAAVLRYSYGNLFERLVAPFKRRFGWRKETVIGAIGILTLLAWIVVFLSADEESKIPFGDLIPKFFGGQSDQAPKD